MSRIIVVSNQKGGVGKTTTAVNLAACLAQNGKKTLLIDSDPQGNATSGLGFDKREIEYSLYEVALEDVEISKSVLPTEVENLSILPSSINLAALEIEIATLKGREFLLKKQLEKIRDEYEYIIIDAPPSLGLITINDLTAADEVLIPIQCEFYALEGLSQLINTISLVKGQLNKNLTIEGVVLTMFNGRTNLSIQVADNVKQNFGDKVHTAVIPRNVRLGEAPSFGQPITVYDSKCVGAEAYRDLAKEIMEG